MNSICPILDCHYGAIPADDCNTSWLAVKVDRAGNQTILDDGFATEGAAEDCAAIAHASDLDDHMQAIFAQMHVTLGKLRGNLAEASAAIEQFCAEARA